MMRLSSKCSRKPVTRFASLICVLLVVSNGDQVTSFQHTAFVPRQSCDFGSLSRLRRFAGEGNAEKEGSKSATLRFSAEKSVTSDAAPKATSDKILQFFQLEEARNYLMSNGGKQPVEATDTTTELLERWKIEASKMNAEEPSLDDVVLRVTTGGISFPGLKLVSRALIGSKLLKTSDTSNYPEYQFTLITDERFAEGAPPIVWIYNQLTGSGKKADASKETSAHSLSRVTVGEVGDEIGFTIASSLEIDVNFPSLLLRILPISKEKAEEQGSAAVLDTISKNIEASINGFRDKYDSSWTSL